MTAPTDSGRHGRHRARDAESPPEAEAGSTAYESSAAPQWRAELAWPEPANHPAPEPPRGPRPYPSPPASAAAAWSGATGTPPGAAAAPQPWSGNGGDRPQNGHGGARRDPGRNGGSPNGGSQWDPWRNSSSAAPVSPAVETTVLPSVDKDQTGVIATGSPAAAAAVPPPSPAPPSPAPPMPEPPMPAASAAAPRADQTSLLGIVPPAPQPDPEAERPRPQPKPGEQVVQLRAVPTKTGGYRSIYATLTRTTVGSVVRTTVRGLGEGLITLGVIVLLLAAYEVWGKAAVVADHQNDLDEQLEEAWAGAEPNGDEREKEGSEPLGPPPGDAIARLYIPKIDKHWVVVEGVELADIRYAPGHYPDSAMPGQVGNFSVAGHRNPATFWDLDKVAGGDAIVVETRDTWYIYEATENHIVSPSDVDVVSPVPGQPGAEPTEPFLTLTTCNPKWDNYERLIVHARLVGQEPRTGDEDRPDVLGDLGS